MRCAIKQSLAALLCLIVALLGGGRSAHAQSVEAETLFREAKRLLKAGDVAAACDKFAASLRLEPTVGTQLNLADCFEKNGQLASAWAMFAKAAATAKRAGDDSKRETEARRRATDLEDRLVYLTIVVPDEVRVDGLVVKSNDETVDSALWGQRVPVDANKYVITAEAPGYDAWTTTVSVRAKNKKVEIPPLERNRADRASTTRREQVAERGKPPTESESNGFTGSQKTAIGLSIVGVVGVGVGISFGVHANTVEGQANTTCPGTTCSDSQAVDLNHTARTDALIANISYAVGGAALLGGAALWVFGPARSSQVAISPVTSHSMVGLAVSGVF